MKEEASEANRKFCQTCPVSAETTLTRSHSGQTKNARLLPVSNALKKSLKTRNRRSENAIIYPRVLLAKIWFRVSGWIG